MDINSGFSSNILLLASKASNIMPIWSICLIPKYNSCHNPVVKPTLALNPINLQSRTCKNNKTLDISFSFSDYSPPPPPSLFNVEKQFDLIIYLCIVRPTLFVGGGWQWLSCLNNFCMRDSISCKNNEIFDITFCDYFSPSPLFIDEKNLTWQYTFVSFVQQCLWWGGGNELVVSIIFVRDCRFNPNHNPNRVNTNPNARINRNPNPSVYAQKLLR